jgi:pyruvate kinase
MVQKELRTRIIATLGPASGSYEVMERMAQAGVAVFRTNCAHIDYDVYRGWLHNVWAINEKLGTQVKMQADIQGPIIRLGELPEEGIFLKAGEEYTFATTAGESHFDPTNPHPSDIPINDGSIHQFVQPGQPIALMSGMVEGEIARVEGHRITVRMINSGKVTKHKTMNFPETELNSALTQKDWNDIDFLLEAGVDWFALSFVTHRLEIDQVREKIQWTSEQRGGRPIYIMSKIERPGALTNIVEIVKASDAIMVARGDLGVEIPYEDVPVIQQDLIELCHHEKKPVVIATQMLYSMMHSQRPTRAEVSDVANAVFQRADAVMLSEESAQGVDPVNAVETMARIVRRAEEHMYKEPNLFGKYWSL